MAQEILVNQIRGNSQINSKPIPVQKDQMNWKMATDLGGASPYDSYWLRTMEGVGLLDIQRLDLLQDMVTTEKFRVFGRPMTHGQSYIKIPVEQVMGT